MAPAAGHASSSRREQPDRPDRRTTARIPGAFNDPEEGSILEENLPTAATQREELGKEELITHALQYLQDVNGDRARRVARFNNRIRIDGQFVDAHGLRQKIHDLPGYAEKILAALIEGTVADQQCRELYALAAAHQDELTILLERDNDNQKQLADQHEELVALRTKRTRDRQRAEVTQDLLTEKIRDLRAELDQTAPRNPEAPRPTVERRQTSTPHPRGSQTIPDEESDDFGSDQEPAKTKFAIRKVFPDP